MRGRLTGPGPMLLEYADVTGTKVIVSIGSEAAVINGVVFTSAMLRGIAALSQPSHLMSECVWADCPEHACPYDFSHTSGWCDRPTCRES